ncbi:uncharacterized protein LOC100049121 [Xenopus laevis]|uniref:LOC100049121 protein n=1 Tax=Xenopus laevis TaxID=8355 RepID=A3KNF4_XENLA|nr:uncharacterized protein LOC100049121 [Xenopus laevis]AAI33812.1 LOC100049121 protein [Xenopus laevis]
MMCGGTGKQRAADTEVQEICEKVKAEFVQKSGVNSSVFEAVSYKTQVVAGTNYFIKAHIGGNKCAHLRVYKRLPHQQEVLSLDSFLLDKTMEEEIVYF